MTSKTIRERSEAIRLGNKHLADMTGLAEHTIGRALKRTTGGNVDTEKKISRAVTTEELRLRDYLVDLHPLANKQMRRAS